MGGRYSHPPYAGQMTTPQENFGRWLDEHYAPIDDDHEGPDFRCRRCGQAVSYVTKHAVVRHGDDIAVMPVAKQELAESY